MLFYHCGHYKSIEVPWGWELSYHLAHVDIPSQLEVPWWWDFWYHLTLVNGPKQIWNSMVWEFWYHFIIVDIPSQVEVPWEWKFWDHMTLVNIPSQFEIWSSMGAGSFISPYHCGNSESIWNSMGGAEGNGYLDIGLATRTPLARKQGWHWLEWATKDYGRWPLSVSNKQGTNCFTLQQPSSKENKNDRWTNTLVLTALEPEKVAKCQHEIVLCRKDNPCRNMRRGCNARIMWELTSVKRKGFKNQESIEVHTDLGMHGYMREYSPF